MDAQSIEKLDEETAWSLLRSQEIGRLALSVSGQPDIVPLNFFVAGNRSVLIKTAPGTKLLEVVINERVAFEADAWDAVEAWSVVVKGRAHRVDHESELTPEQMAALRPWAPTFKNSWIVISADEVTGRRFRRGQPEPELDDSGTD